MLYQNSKSWLVKIWQSCFEGIRILETTRAICQCDINTRGFIWSFETSVLFNKIFQIVEI